VELTVKITPRVAAGVARRLRLAASVRSRSMSAMVNDALDEALPSLEEIRMQLAAPAAAGPGLPAGMAGRPLPATATAARETAAATAQLEGAGDDGVR
jgi:plasmid stability protein